MGEIRGSSLRVQVGQGALTDLLAPSPAFAQQDGGSGITIGTVSMYMGTCTAHINVNTSIDNANYMGAF